MYWCPSVLVHQDTYLVLFIANTDLPSRLLEAEAQGQVSAFFIVMDSGLAVFSHSTKSLSRLSNC